MYGLEESNGTRFLVLELAEGEDLSARLQRGPIPTDEAIPIAAQIADALEAAHEKGIIHRDLKPANIKLSEEGQVKLLDFGLAKALDVDESDPDLSNSPTMVRAATHLGVILGTAAYMSPSRRAARRSTSAPTSGHSASCFTRCSRARGCSRERRFPTLASVLTKVVDVASLPPALPETVRTMIGHCLERDPHRRLRDIGDARLELEETLAGRTASGHVRVVPAAKIPRPVIARWAIAAALIGLVVGGALGGWLMARRKFKGPASTSLPMIRAGGSATVFR